MFVFINTLVKDLKQSGLRERELAWLSNGVVIGGLREGVTGCEITAIPSARTLRCPDGLPADCAPPADWGCIFLCH